MDDWDSDPSEAAWRWALAFAAVVLFAAGAALYVAIDRIEDPDPVAISLIEVIATTNNGVLLVDDRPGRDLDPYFGYGTWVDVFDYDPAYTGPDPSIDATQFDEMASLGVKTIYFQAARLDDRTPDGLVDPWRLMEFVLTAHDLNVDVVAWYLPRFGEGTDDLDRLLAMSDFEVLGHRFDGIAVDIEWTGDGIDHETRSTRLTTLSEGISAATGDDPLGAIVLPPVLTEVVNTDFWPGFPWTDIADDYDVWLPMSYWSFRSESSGYGSGYEYHEESVRRLRSNLGDPDAVVHGIGGIGGVDGFADEPDPPEPLASIEEIEAFVDALVDTGSVGGSIYDWATLEPAVRDRLAEIFGSGAGSTLGGS